MVELRIEDPDGFQNFVRCEPAMFQEMVYRLTPLICKLDNNYSKVLDPGLKVAIALHYMATGDSSKSLQYGTCLLIAEVTSPIVDAYHEDVIVMPTILMIVWSLPTTTAASGSTIIALGQWMVSMWPSENL